MFHLPTVFVCSFVCFFFFVGKKYPASSGGALEPIYAVINKEAKRKNKLASDAVNNNAPTTSVGQQPHAKDPLRDEYANLPAPVSCKNG